MKWDWRERYGRGWLTVLPDGTEIPWKPLSIGDYIYYSHAIAVEGVPTSIIEDEIFKKCCLRPALLQDINTQLAGNISEVVRHILEKSGPPSPEAFNENLAAARKESELPMNAMLSIICQAFPSYRPEDIEALDIDKFMLRLAQAEAILLRNKILEKPISLLAAGPATRRGPRLTNNLKQEFDKQKPPAQAVPKGTAIINMDQENAAVMGVVGGNKWDKEKRAKLTKDMVTRARHIYGDPEPPPEPKPQPQLPTRKRRRRG